MTDERLPQTVPTEANVRVESTGPIVHRCPYTDEEDPGTVTITWTCVGYSIELHSLRRYIDEFEEAAISHEACVQLVRDELASLDGIDDVTVIAMFTTAGMAVEVTAYP